MTSAPFPSRSGSLIYPPRPCCWRQSWADEYKFANYWKAHDFILQPAINELLGDPAYNPPEIIFTLQLNAYYLSSLKSFLGQFRRKILVEFAIGEAKLVLQYFEKAIPSDDRPRLLIEASEEHLKRNYGVASNEYELDAHDIDTLKREWAKVIRNLQSSIVHSPEAHYAACAVYNTYCAARSSGYRCGYVALAAEAARSAGKFSLKDQLKRLLKIWEKESEQFRHPPRPL